MNKSIEIIKKPRIQLTGLVQKLTVEQLNEISAGFNNNILWNLGHLIATEQAICYKRAGLEIRIDESVFLAYKGGTKPQKFIDAGEVDEISKLLISSIGQLEIDYQDKLFTNYTSWTTGSGIEINNIDDALNFLPFHEGLHIGHIMAMSRILMH